MNKINMILVKTVFVINLLAFSCYCQDFKIDNDKSGLQENSQKVDDKTVIEFQNDIEKKSQNDNEKKSQNDNEKKSQNDNEKDSLILQLLKDIDEKSKVVPKPEEKPKDEEIKKDKEEEIYRPCPTNDVECIKHFFSSRSYCTISYGQKPEMYFRPQTNLYYPLFSLSVTQVGTYTSGLNGTIKEFYVDRATDSIVLEIQFTNFLINSTLDIYSYHRPGKVDAITRSDSRIYLPSFTITTVFRGTVNIELGRSVSTAFIETMGSFELNSSAGVHSDSIVSSTFGKFSSSKLEVMQEGFLVLAPYYAGLFIQNNICDFGLEFI